VEASPARTHGQHTQADGTGEVESRQDNWSQDKHLKPIHMSTQANGTPANRRWPRWQEDGREAGEKEQL